MKAKIDSRKKIENARKKLQAGDLLHALSEVEDVLRLDDTNTDARTLKQQIEAERARRAELRVAQALREADREHDPERRVELLTAVAREFSGHRRLELTLAIAEAQRDVYRAHRARIGVFEQHGRMAEAQVEREALAKIFPHAPAPKPRPIVVAGASGAAAAPAPAKAPAPAPRVPKPVVARKSSPKLLYAGGGVAAALAIIGLAIGFGGGKPASALSIDVQPSDARIEIDGTPWSGDTSKLTAGTHKVAISRLGYSPVTQELTWPGGSIRAALAPLAPQVRIDTNLAAGDYLLDDQPARPLENGQAILEALTAGRHVVKVNDPKYGEAVFEFEVAPASAPRIISIPPAKEMVAFAATSFEQAGRLHATVNGSPVRKEDGSEIGTTAPEGVALQGLKQGEVLPLIVGSGEQEWRVFGLAEPQPVLALFVRVNVTTGGFLVRADQDDAVVRVNGKASLKLRAGELRALRGLDPGKYEVRVEKPGFRSDPIARTVVVARGKEDRVEFRLIPTLSIEVRGAAPGARVSVNGTDLGLLAVDGNGTVSANGISGPCRIELRREGFETKRVERDCKPGERVSVTGDDAKMAYVWGHLAIEVNAPEWRVTAQASGQPDRVLSKDYPQLPAGSYTLIFRAPGYEDKRQEVRVTAGRSTLVNVEMKKAQ